MMDLLKNVIIIALTLSTLFMISCNDGDDTGEKGTAQVSVTDAAVDAENITGVYLSVSEIHAASNSEVTTLTTFEELAAGSLHLRHL